MDKTITEGFLAEHIISILRDERLRQDGIKIVFLSYVDSDKVNFITINKDSGQIISYPMEMETAVFNAYCLLQAAVNLSGSKEVFDYIDELSGRRNEIVEWIDKIKKLFKRANANPV